MWAKLGDPAPKYLPGYIVKKYNIPNIVSFDFTPKSLNKLSTYYHTLDIPEFVWQQNSGKAKIGTIYQKKTDDGRFVSMINSTYYDHDRLQLLKDQGKLGTLKDANEGLVMISWFNHPNLPKKNTPGALNIAAVEKGGPRYIASLLDLNQSDLPSLKALLESTKKNLKNDFGVGDSDKVNMYFHFPYQQSTIGLHLHIRVNQLHHELEVGKSFSLSEVIAHLEKNGDIRDLILERQQKYGGTIMNPGDVTNTLRDLGVPVRDVPNPFYDPNMRVAPE